MKNKMLLKMTSGKMKVTMTDMTKASESSKGLQNHTRDETGRENNVKDT